MKALLVPAVCVFVAGSLCAAEKPEPEVASGQFTADCSSFIRHEIEAHIAAVQSVEPPQPLVLGVPTKGDFTWGSLMRAITACSALTGEQKMAGRNLPEFLGKLGLIEARQGSKTFSQLGAALTLRHFGTDLQTNALWQSLSPSERDEWRSLLDPGRFYDRTNRQVINLPENYFGVAARIVTMDYHMGLVTDRAFVDDIVTRAAGQFLKGALYTDDNLPTGRFDRYSQEYARFVLEAATNPERKDIQKAVAPALKAVMKTWWDLVGPDGCGYPWGRTIGAMSYMDTMEIIGFLADHPEYRPAPLPALASVYRAAWQWLQHDYQPDRHLLNIFGFGRGNYKYMSPERQWQQTTAYLAKSADSLRLLKKALETEHVTTFPSRPPLPEVARWEWFRDTNRLAGTWLVRFGSLRLTLPITTGTVPGIADYLPSPHGLPGFAAPVEQTVPAMTPYLELADGRVIVAGDGADEIKPSPDAHELRAAWKRWVIVDAGKAQTEAEKLVNQPGTLVEPGLVTEVTWRLEGASLVRHEIISANKPVTIRRFSFLFPSTGALVETRLEHDRRIDRFDSAESSIEVMVTQSSFPLKQTLQASGNSALGKGTRGPIPQLLWMESKDLKLEPRKALEWTIRIRQLAKEP